MSTSGSYDHSTTRNEIVTDSLKYAGLLSEGETASAEQVSDGARTLEDMIKGWQAQGIHIWKQEEMVLFLVSGQYEYTLGTASTTANFTKKSELVTTAIKVAASDTDTTIDVDSITGIASGDYIGIVMDDNTIHWTTVNGAPAGDTVTLTAAIDDDAAIDNAVYVFTNKGPRPLQIPHGRCQTSTTNELEMTDIGSEDFFRFSNKTVTGVPTQYYYRPNLPSGKMYIHTTPTNDTYYLNLTCYIPFEDFDAAGNEPDFPQEWFAALKWNLAETHITGYGITDPVTVAKITEMAQKTLKSATDFDVDEGDVLITFDLG